MAHLLEIKDLQKHYHRRVPKMFRDYCESGSWSGQTLRANTEDFQKLLFRQRVGYNLEGRSTRTKLLGQDAAMPVAMAPVGLLGMQHPDGEIKAARACRDFGVPFTLSTMSICSIEAVAEATQAPFWFQLYVMRDKDFTRGLIERAKAAECSALVVTMDLQVLGKRHADTRNGMTAPPKLTIPNIVNIGLHPLWALGMARAKHRQFGNIQGYADNTDSMGDLMKWTANQFDPALNWDDVKRFRDQWDKPLIVKGIMEIEDAVAAFDAGADAIVVSNHGGRQLDGAPSAISVLAEIVDAVGGRGEIHIDSGVRSGQDVIRACALGAKGVMMGRGLVYGLGAGGQAGVTRALEIVQQEADLTLGFIGHQSIYALNRGDLR